MTEHPRTETRFLVEVRKAGFGIFPIPDEVLIGIARDACKTIRAGTPTGDIETALFDTAVKPTFEQVRIFVRAAITHLAPELEFAPGGVQFTTGITVGQALARPTEQIVAKVDWAMSWATSRLARAERLSHVPFLDDDPEPAYAIADAWTPPDPLALPSDLCDRLRAAAGTVEETPSGNGTYFHDPVLDDADLAAVVDRFAEANRLSGVRPDVLRRQLRERPAGADVEGWTKDEGHHPVRRRQGRMQFTYRGGGFGMEDVAIWQFR